MMTMKRLAGGVALAALLSAGATAVHAQETTGSIRGRITDDAGRPIAGATVVVRHEPTGSSATQVTGSDGFFSARGLRVGGPYSVTATAPDYASGGVTLPAIGVGDGGNIAISLAVESGAQVEELVVTAAPKASSSGPSIAFNENDLRSIPTISRDLKDVARLDPFATIDPNNSDALSFAGANTRFNQLTVDGVRQNDDFGLNNNGYPTQRSPISLEAIEAVSVSSAPYSVINNGFTGGQINAVTKSGTNAFSGSAFYEKTGRELQGDKIDGVRAGAEFDEKTWGATLGGPIIKDRLFFFLSYEKFKGSLGLDEGPFDLPVTSKIPRITSTAAETFRQAAESIYGYDPGGFVQGVFPLSDEKYLAKIDWQISDDHRLAVTYQKTEGNSLNGATSNPTNNGNSITQPRLGLETNQYNKIELLETYTAQLNSDWTENFSTELRYSHKLTDTTQDPLGGLSVGEVTVNVADLPGVAAGVGTPQIRFGADLNRHDNYLRVKLDTMEAIARYRLGPHNFTVGLRTEKDDIFNVFVANSVGSYGFNSYADFLARRAATFTLTGGVDPTAGTAPATLGTARLGAADFSFRLSSFYAEDRIQVTPDLDISVGARFDWYSMSDVPTLNTSFVTRNGFSNQQSLDGKSVVLPRISFNWSPRERLSVTGGLGLFSATGLNVWLSNPFANNGVNQTNAVCPAGPFLNVDLTRVPAGCTFTPGNGNTNVLDPSLRIPTTWKGNISVGYSFDLGRFGDEWLVQLDYLKSKNQNSLYWYDLRAQQIGVAPDGRPVYGRRTGPSTANVDTDLMLSNIDGGGSDAVAFTLAKEWREGWAEGLSARFGYTYTNAEDVNPMTSSIAFSSYTRFGALDPNHPVVARSDYEVRDRFTIDLAYERKFFGDNKTTFHVFAQHRSGLPFSYTFANSRSGNFDNDFGYAVSSYSGRVASSNALLYVPTASDARVVYAPGFDTAAFQNFLQTSGLAKYAGGIAPRNAFDNPDVTTIDLHISQELPAFFPGGAKLEVYMDLENLGNLLNSKWGVLEQYDFSKNVPVVNVQCGAGGAPACAAPGAVYTYSGTGAGGAFVNPPKASVVTNSSLWQVKFGVRYRF